jgi:hypothetical protein
MFCGPAIHYKKFLESLVCLFLPKHNESNTVSYRKLRMYFTRSIITNQIQKEINNMNFFLDLID